jgi:hypothetical protein
MAYVIGIQKELHTMMNVRGGQNAWVIRQMTVSLSVILRKHRYEDSTTATKVK